MTSYVYNVSYINRDNKTIYSEDFGSIYDTDKFIYRNSVRGKYECELLWSSCSGSKRIYKATIDGQSILIVSQYIECDEIRSRICRLQYLYKKDRKKVIEKIKALY